MPAGPCLQGPLHNNHLKVDLVLGRYSFAQRLSLEVPMFSGQRMAGSFIFGMHAEGGAGRSTCSCRIVSRLRILGRSQRQRCDELVSLEAVRRSAFSWLGPCSVLTCFLLLRWQEPTCCHMRRLEILWEPYNSSHYAVSVLGVETTLKSWMTARSLGPSSQSLSASMFRQPR